MYYPILLPHLDLRSSSEPRRPSDIFHSHVATIMLHQLKLGLSPTLVSPMEFRPETHSFLFFPPLICWEKLYDCMSLEGTICTNYEDQNHNFWKIQAPKYWRYYSSEGGI